MSSVAANLLVVAFSNLLTTVVNFIYYPILTRGLGFSAEILGRYQFYFSTVSVLIIFSLLSTNYVFIAETKKHSNKETLWFVNTAILTCSVFYICSVLLLSFFMALSSRDILFLVFLGITDIIFLLGNTILRDGKLFGVVAKLTVLKSLANLLIGIGVGFFWRSEETLVLAFGISALLTGVMSIINRFGRSYRLDANFKYFSGLLSDGKSIVFFQTAVLGLGSFTQNLPVFAIGTLFDDQSVGYYSLSVKLLGATIALLSGALGQTFLPYFSKSESDEKRIFEKQSLVSATFFPVFCVLSLVSPAIIPLLFGREFLSAVDLLLFMIPQYFLMSTITPYTSTFISHKKSHILLILHILNTPIMLSVVFPAKVFGFNLTQTVLCFVIVSVINRFLTMILSFRTAGVSWKASLLQNGFFTACLFGLAIPTKWSYVFLLGNVYSFLIFSKNKNTIINIKKQVLSKFSRKKKRME